VAERGKAGSGRKFSITIQVPEEVGAGWPDRATAERLVSEVYQAMGGQAPSARPARRSRVVAVVAAFALGAVAGYGGAAVVTGLRSRVGTAPAAEPTQLPPASERPAEVPVITPQPAPAAEPASAPPPQAAAPAPSPAASPAAPAPDGLYRVQVGAFRLRENATAQVARLARDGFRAEVRRFGVLYVVLVGPSQSRDDADRLAARLRERGYDALVTRGP
jgi:cell division septation protein DedD